MTESIFTPPLGITVFCEFSGAGTVKKGGNQKGHKCEEKVKTRLFTLGVVYEHQKALSCGLQMRSKAVSQKHYKRRHSYPNEPADKDRNRREALASTLADRPYRKCQISTMRPCNTQPSTENFNTQAACSLRGSTSRTWREALVLLVHVPSRSGRPCPLAFCFMHTPQEMKPEQPMVRRETLTLSRRLKAYTYMTKAAAKYAYPSQNSKMHLPRLEPKRKAIIIIICGPCLTILSISGSELKTLSRGTDSGTRAV